MSFFEADVLIVVANGWTLDVIPDAVVSFLNLGTGDIFEGRTNAAGDVMFRVRPGQYGLFVNKSGFREFSQVVGVGLGLIEIPVLMIPSTGTPPIIPPTVVEVGVTVVNEAGNRLGGATVVLGGVVQTTSAFGFAVFPDMPIAVLDWTVSLSGFNDSTGIIDSSRITDFVVVLIDISQPPPPPILEHTITVSVVDTNGTPLPNIRVRVVRREGGFDAARSTDANGLRVFRNALAGTYDVSALSRADAGFDDVTLFVDRDVTVNLSVPLIWLLSVTSEFGGTTDPSGRNLAFTDGSIVQVKGTPLPLYKFTGWNLDGQPFTDNPIAVEMLSDHVIHGGFSLVEVPDIQRTLLIVGAVVVGGFLLLRRD